MKRHFMTSWSLALACLLPASVHAQDRDALISSYKKVIEDFRSRSPVIGQGNPKVTQHPMTTEQCLSKLAEKKVVYENPEFETICGAKYMAPLYDPATQKPQDAKACIDQFEYPNIPCEYPVVWVQANEAVDICQSLGKRICDAHEWEGGCAGALLAPDYMFDQFTAQAPVQQIRSRRSAHNRVHDKDPVWSYGKERKKGNCAMNSFKHDGCNGGDWQRCGSNTYPVGAFPECGSPLGVYDIHGNAAEHMNLPTKEDEMASKGSKKLGYTEMKGSWFIWDKYQAHPDHCRWRAPYWHGSKIMDPKSHSNYHLGFRCCKTL
jgi:formylglycine-generating enzyme required for sulfatase activity